MPLSLFLVCCVLFLQLTHEQSVDADDTFGQVIARYKNTQLSYDLLQSLYLVDQNKGTMYMYVYVYMYV